MMYEDVIGDFAHRTLKNLEAIERMAGNGEPVYEATQLINSMLGLLVFPREEFYQSIPPTRIEELQASGWPIPRVVGTFNQVEDLRQLVRYLRNAVAHFNLKFIGDGTSEVALLQVWNSNFSGQPNWKVELSLEDLRGITSRFLELVLRG